MLKKMKTYRVDSVTQLENGLVLVSYNDGTTLQLSGMEAFDELADVNALEGVLDNVSKMIAVCLFKKNGGPTALLVDVELNSNTVMEAILNG